MRLSGGDRAGHMISFVIAAFLVFVLFVVLPLGVAIMTDIKPLFY